MKIIVIQRHFENLVGIKAEVAKINQKRAEEIIFTNVPEEVLDAVHDGLPVIVVSGQVFGPFLFSGTDLARQVKQVNPQAQFYMYSVIPERNEAVDGVIPKRNGTAVNGQHPVLAGILTSDLDGATPETLRRTFQVS